MLIFFRFLPLVLMVTVGVSAAEPAAHAPVEQPAAVSAASSVPEEEKWIFVPTPGRVDAFNDIEVRLRIEAAARQANPGDPVHGPVVLTNPNEKTDQAIEWGAKEADRVESLILVRKWDETILACENAVKMLEKYQSNAPVAELIERFKRYRTQAEEAKIYEEAQTKFDALGLKIEGILWSPEGSLAVIGGEPRALKINDRAKDCVIINIDTNRVDFLFHYLHRRFEFQRYVGEVANASRGR